MHEAQTTSDAQMRQVQQLLQGSLTQMTARHPQAAANIKAAIAEIDKALAVR